MSGAVGLVFRNEDHSRYLIVHSLASGGPAEKSGMIRLGDRLVKIDGVTLGSAALEEVPQLPGAHGTLVRLTLERPSRPGGAFDPSQGIISYTVDLIRDASFFPDKLAPTTDSRPTSIASVSSSMMGGSTPQMDRDSVSSMDPSRSPTQSGGWHSTSGYDRLAAMAAANVPSMPPRPTSEGPRSVASAISYSDSPPKGVREGGLAPLGRRNGGGSSRGGSQLNFGQDDDDQTKMTVDAEKVMQDEIVIQALRTELDKRTRTIEKMLEQREEEAREMESLRKDVSVKQSRVEQLEGERDRSSREFWKQMEEMQDEFTIKLERITAASQKEIDVLRAERDRAAGTAGVAIGQQERSRALEDELKGQIENLRGQLSAAEREAVSGKQRIREFEEEVKVVKARMSDAESLEAMIRQKDAAIEEVKQRHIDFTTKTTAAMRALSTDLSEMTNERDRLMADLAKARLSSTDLKAITEERDRALNDVSSARKEVKLLSEREAEARRINEGMSIELREAKLALQKAAQMASTPQSSTHASPPSQAYAAPSSPATFGLEPMTPAPPQQQQRPETEIDKVMNVYLNGGKLTPEHVAASAQRTQEVQQAQLASPAAAAAASPIVAAPSKVMRCQVAKARNLPDSQPGAAALITVRLGSNQVQTKKATPAGAPQWHETFDLSLDSPSTVDDMATFLLRRVEQGAADDGVDVGYVAVPVGRVMQSSKEEGWYELRTVEDEVVCGPGGVSEVLIRLSVEDRHAASGPQAAATADKQPEVPVEMPHVDVQLLDVTIVKARHLPGGSGTSNNAVPDAHAVLQIGASTRRTHTIKGTRTPEWTEGFTLPVTSAAGAGAAGDLASVVVWDANGGSPSSGGGYIGHIAVPISRIKQGSGEEGWYDMRDQQGEMVPGGPEGAPGAALLVKFRHKVLPGGLKATRGWLTRPAGGGVGGAAAAAAGGEVERVWCVLDPYTRTLGVHKREGAEEANAAYWVSGCGLQRLAEGSLGGGMQGYAFEVTLAGSGERIRLCAENRADWETWFAAFRLSGCKDSTGAASTTPPVVTSPSPPLLVNQPYEQQKAASPAASSLAPSAAVAPHVASQGAAHPAAAPAPRPPPPPVDATLPQGILEAFIIRARHLPPIPPTALPSSQAATVAEIKVCGRSAVAHTRETGSAVSFNENFQFPVDTADDALATVVIWGIDSAGTRALVGHIAVPVSRIASSATRREEGWYDVRSSEGTPLSTTSGPSAILVNFVWGSAVEMRVPRGWATVIGDADSRNSEKAASSTSPAQELFCAIDPYAQQLLGFASPPASLSAGVPIRRFPIRGCTILTSDSEVAESYSRLMPGLAPPPSPAFTIGIMGRGAGSSGGSFECMLVVADHAQRDMWAASLSLVGNPPSQQSVAPAPVASSQAPMAVQPAAQSAGPMVPPSQQAAPQNRVRIVVEKARNLPSTESGCFCVAQGSSKEGQPKRTKVATGSSPVWAETFEVSVPSDSGDLVSVALWAGGAGGGYLGHVAVPMTRIEAAGKEEGWYEIRTQTGELVVGGDEGVKSSILVRFSILK